MNVFNKKILMIETLLNFYTNLQNVNTDIYIKKHSSFKMFDKQYLIYCKLGSQMKTISTL